MSPYFFYKEVYIKSSDGDIFYIHLKLIKQTQMKVRRTIYKILNLVGIKPDLSKYEALSFRTKIVNTINESIKDIRLKTDDYKSLDTNKCYIYEGFDTINDSTKYYYHINFDARNSTLHYSWTIYKHGILIYEMKSKKIF